MTILALEFSSPQRSVAVLQTGAREDVSAVGEVIETGMGVTRGVAMVEEALRSATLEREQVDCLVVGLGPGSYTGIRAAIALAQGWQLARKVKLLGVSSAECVAAQAQAEGVTGRMKVVIDAQRDEFYLADYEVNARHCRETAPLRLASLAELRGLEQAGEILVGPEVTRWFPAGRVIFPRAATLGRLVYGRNDFVAGEKLEPIYLREVKFVKAPLPRVVPEK
jgi:tRNA threonylcarbamoyl adenosine modification protein YeaZ